MNYLVTGGCGFIGSHLCDELIRRGHHVRVLDDLSTGKRENLNPAAELVVGSITDIDTVKKAMENMDGCFHLAAIASVERSTDEWLGTHLVNQSGTINVLEASRRTARLIKPPVVYASSAAIYGDNANMPLTEIDSACPISAYGADKMACELQARVATLVHKVSTTGLRFFNVYGPRQDPKSPYSGVISIFSDKILRAETLTIFGDGQQARDFIYVADVVNYLIAAMERSHMVSKPAVFNVCTGRTTTVLQLAKTLSAVASMPLDIVYQPARKGDIRTSLGDPSKAIQAFQLQALTSLGVGLNQTLSFLLETNIEDKQVRAV